MNLRKVSAKVSLRSSRRLTWADTFCYWSTLFFAILFANGQFYVCPRGSHLLFNLPNGKISDQSTFIAFADDIIILTQKFEICVGKSRKHCGTMFSIAIFSRGVKSRDCEVKG